MDEAFRRKLKPIFGHHPFTEALSQTLRALFSSAVWLLALASKIKATEMSVTHSQSGVKVQESFLKNNDNNKKITIRRLEKFNFQIEITGEIVFSSGTEKSIPCSSRGHRLWQMAQPQQHKPFNTPSDA